MLGACQQWGMSARRNPNRQRYYAAYMGHNAIRQTRYRVICFRRSRAHLTRGERLPGGNRSIGIDVNGDSRQRNGRRSLQNAKRTGGIKNRAMQRTDEVPAARVVIDSRSLVGTGTLTGHKAAGQVDQ